MKTKSIKRVMIVGSALLIGVVICASAWFFLREHKAMEIQEQSQQSHQNTSTAANNQTSKIVTPSNNREGPLTRGEKLAQQSRSMLMSHLSPEQLSTPHMQKMLEVMDSPEFAELPSNFSTHEWKDFLESKGVPVTRGNPGLFTEHLPFMSLDDYEPIVRQKLAEFFLAAEPVNLTDPQAASLQRAKVLIELDDTDENGLSWFMERFGDDWSEAFRVHEGMENNPAVIWMTEIQQNAQSIIEAAERARVDALEASTPSWDMSSVMESPSVSPEEIEIQSPSINTPLIEALERATIPNAETDAAATPNVSDAPEAPNALPAEQGLETALKARFSSERFEQAMSTLERYGPDEGLRRIRENDPEVANQIKRHRNREGIPK